VFHDSILQDVPHGSESSVSQLVAGKSSAILPNSFHQVPKLILDEEYLKHLGELRFHLPVLYKVVRRSLQDMHLGFLLKAACTICGELKAPNVRPRGYALALTILKAMDCPSGMIKPSSADADGIASTLKTFVDRGKSSAAGENVSCFLPPRKNVALPSL